MNVEDVICFLEELYREEDRHYYSSRVADVQTFVEQQKEQLEKANSLLINLKPNLEDERQDEVTAYLDEYKI